MTTLRRAGRVLLLSGVASALGYAGLVAAVSAASGPDWRMPLPDWSDWLGGVALLLLVAGLLASGLAARGWVRVAALAVAPLVGLFGFAALVVAEFLGQHSERGRVVLPDGRVVSLTLEPVPTDSVYALWQLDGWGWRPLLHPVEQLSYSEDGSFTHDPGLVATPDGTKLLIRRGGIWTDCVEVSGPPRLCAGMESWYPVTRGDFLARSIFISARTGMAEPEPSP